MSRTVRFGRKTQAHRPTNTSNWEENVNGKSSSRSLARLLSTKNKKRREKPSSSSSVEPFSCLHPAMLLMRLTTASSSSFRLLLLLSVFFFFCSHVFGAVTYSSLSPNKDDWETPPKSLYDAACVPQFLSFPNFRNKPEMLTKLCLQPDL